MATSGTAFPNQLMSEKNLSSMFSLNANKWTHQNERTATAQTYTRFGAAHRVIFVTLALSELFKLQMHAQKIHFQMDKDNKWFSRKKMHKTWYTKNRQSQKVTLLQTCQFHSGPTRIMVEESVFPPEHLRGLHDDSIGKLISHCRLSYSLKNNKKKIRLLYRSSI